MLDKNKCTKCRGHGKLMGGCIADHECDLCHGSGKVIRPDVVESPVEDPLSKDSKAYKKVKAKIKEKFKDISDEEAEHYLDSALNEKTDGS